MQTIRKKKILISENVGCTIGKEDSTFDIKWSCSIEYKIGVCKIKVSSDGILYLFAFPLKHIFSLSSYSLY